MNFSKIAGIALLSLSFCGAGRAQSTLAYDGFNYSAGTLDGRNGGTGWSTPWTNSYHSGASLLVDASGLSYANLSTVGGSAVWGEGGNDISEATRSLTMVNSGVVYFQFLSQLDNSGFGTPNFRLYANGVLTGGLGGNGGTYGAKMSILDNTLSAASDGSSSSPNDLQDLNFTGERIDYQNTITRMWVNPNLATFDYLNPGTADATFAGLAPAFDKLSFYTRDPGQIDELRILTVVPEPAVAYLGLFGAAVMFYGWPRRK